MRNSDDITPGTSENFFQRKFRIINKTIPSKKLSYNCEGCLKRLSTLLKLTEKIIFKIIKK